MQKNKFYSFIGITKKAGAVIAGDHMVEKEMNRGSLHLLVIATDTSERVQAKYRRFCQEKSIPVIFTGTKDDLGHAIGKKQATVLGFKNKNQSENLMKLYENMLETGGVL